MTIFFNLMTKFWIPNKFQLSCWTKWSEKNILLHRIDLPMTGRLSNMPQKISLFSPRYNSSWLGDLLCPLSFHPPPENNVTVKLGQWNLAHVRTCQKATPVPNLVAIAQSVTSLHVINVSSTAIPKVLHMFVNQVLLRYENFASIFIWLFGMLEYCSLHFNRKIAKSLKKLSNTGLQKPLKSSKFWIFPEMLTSAKFLLNFNAFKKGYQNYVFTPKTLINTKYKCQRKEKVEPEILITQITLRYN